MIYVKRGSPSTTWLGRFQQADLRNLHRQVLLGDKQDRQKQPKVQDQAYWTSHLRVLKNQCRLHVHLCSWGRKKKPILSVSSCAIHLFGIAARLSYTSRSCLLPSELNSLLKLAKPRRFVSFLGLLADVQHVVASDEGVTIFVLQLAIDVFLGLLHGEVHVAILEDGWSLKKMKKKSTFRQVAKQTCLLLAIWAFMTYLNSKKLWQTNKNRLKPTAM